MAVLAILLPSFAGASAGASGPRFVTGPPYFTGQAGVPIGWKQQNLMYFTDPGDLSKAVNHQAADALVAAAAGAWNIPIASITLGRGGALAEHVSGQNVYLDQAGMVFPGDVMSANAAAIPIAVIYDTDGSVVDTLLGGGASDPGQCRDNGVIQTVDGFDPAGYILHAVMVVNGRCTGAAPEMQIQMQYELIRAFGRVLGLAWSQTNDNVFMGSPTPTSGQMLHWPLMHPIDILCGPYSYQCLPNPLQLRADDMASMVELYALWDPAKLPAGKHTSLQHAHMARGHIWFPTGEGMGGVNIVLRRSPEGQPFEDWYEASGVTGAEYAGGGRSPFVAGGTDAWASFGTPDQSQMGTYFIAYVPVIAGLDWDTIGTFTEPVNPLYTGALTLGAYAAGNVAPSGSPPPVQPTYYDGLRDTSNQDYTVADAAATCGTGEDGTAAAPVAVPLSGWWNGLLCGMGHASYAVTGVRPGRSFTMEVTALDEQGLATEAKAMPVIGLFAPTDGAGALPSVGIAPAAFQGIALGTTTLHGVTGQLASLRVGIADQRGVGRPDFAYQARLFYADSVSPPQLPVGGGTVTLTGMGFRAGNAVSINGVAAKVTSWTPSSIVLIAPAMAAVRATDGVGVDVVVSDRGTGAESAMTAALMYTSAPRLSHAMKLTGIPAGTSYVGDAAVPAFSVSVVGPDGVTPVAGDTVVFSASAGSVRLSACGAAVCRVTTDAQGGASTGVTPLAAGGVTLTAVDGGLEQSGSFEAEAQAGGMAIASAPSGNLLVGLVAATPFGVRVTAADGTALAGRAITFAVTSGAATFGGCFASKCDVITDGSGLASVPLTPTAVGALTVEASDGDLHRSASATVVPNVDVMKVRISPDGKQYLAGYPIDEFSVLLYKSDGVTPDVGQAVTFVSAAGSSMCGGPLSCVAFTDYKGEAAVSVSATSAGQYTLTASFGAAVQTVSFSVVDQSYTLTLISAPSGSYPVGQPIVTPFTVRVTENGMKPAPGVIVSLSGPLDGVRLTACGSKGGCRMTTDADGNASTSVFPLQTGLMTLTATLGADERSAAFNVTGQPEKMIPVQVPADGTQVGQSAIFEVQLIGQDGLTPEPNTVITFQVVSGPIIFTLCSSFCTTRTDANGYAAVYGSAYAPGLVKVQATKDGASTVMSFTAVAQKDTVHWFSIPPYYSTVGRVASLPFSVHVFDAGNKSVGPGRNVSLSVATGSAGFVACGGASTCVLPTDSTGSVSSLVIPGTVGPILLAASEGGGQTSMGFNGVAPQPGDVLAITAAGGGSVYQGATSATHFSVHAMDAYATPISGLLLTLAGSGVGGVRLEACGAVSCNLVTDANGNASTAVTGVTVGAVTLTAIADLGSGVKTLSAPFLVKANGYSMSALTGTTYIAEGGTQGLALTAAAALDGQAATAQSIHWTSAAPGGFRLTVTDSITDGGGTSSIQAALGPLAAGASATAQACAWPGVSTLGPTGVCAGFEGIGVSLSEQGITLLSGDRQTLTGGTLTGGAVPAPVVAKIVDGAGHSVAAATVHVYQTVSAVSAVCPERGRCPVSPILASLVSVLTSAVDGTISVNPLTLAANPGNPPSTQTDIALTVGTEGFAAAVVTIGP